MVLCTTIEADLQNLLAAVWGISGCYYLCVDLWGLGVKCVVNREDRVKCCFKCEMKPETRWKCISGACEGDDSQEKFAFVVACSNWQKKRQRRKTKCEVRFSLTCLSDLFLCLSDRWSERMYTRVVAASERLGRFQLTWHPSRLLQSRPLTNWHIHTVSLRRFRPCFVDLEQSCTHSSRELGKWKFKESD